MRILILYATTEGQTRKICQFVMSHLTAAGHSAALLSAEGNMDVDPSEFDAAILAASIHAGNFQTPMSDYATHHSKALNAMKTLFLSVSLSAAGDDPDDWAGIERAVDAFTSETGWTPNQVEHVAGAFRFGEYDFFKSWAMRWIGSIRSCVK